MINESLKLEYKTTLIGLTEEQGSHFLALKGLRGRICKKDNKSMMLMRDYNTDRANLEIVNDKITAVHWG